MYIDGVAVFCMAYNHEEYIKQALDGFVMQKLDCNYRIYIHDDASTDNTQKIIKEYEKKYPNIIKGIYEKENQMSKGVDIFLKIVLPLIKEKYIAVCEGDDFWTDKYKLQKQYNFMENNNEYNMCSHAANVLDGNKIIRKIAPLDRNGILTTNMIIEKGGGIVATNSLFFKREMFNNIPGFYNNFPYDYTLEIFGSLKNGLYYISEIMSTYRYCSNGSWSESMLKNKEKMINHTNKVIESLNILNRENSGKYRKSIKRRTAELKLNILDFDGDLLKLTNNEYFKLFNMLSFKNKLFYIKNFIRKKWRNE